MKHLGDFDASTVVYGKFTTYRPSSGAAYTLAGTPALSVYKDNSTTQSTTGVTLTADFDSVTGLNHFAVDTSADGTFYAAGSFFDVVITTGTVDSVSVVGSVVASFTIRKNSALKPATAGRTLVVDASGLADANVVKVGPSGSGTAQTARDIGASDFTATMKTSIGTAVAASAVASVTGNVGGNVTGSVGSVVGAVGSVTGLTAATVHSDLDDIQSRLPAALVSGRMDSSVGAMAANVITAAATAADFTTEVTAGLSTLDAAGVRTAVGLATANLDTQLDALPTAAENADAVWEEAIADHNGTVGSTAEALSAAGAAGDPWNTALPGAYAAGKAGYIVGTNLDAVLSAVKSKTDNLPSDPADESLVIAATDAIAALIGTPAVSVSDDIAAVKVDTAAIKVYADRTVVRGTVSATSPGTASFTSSALSPAGVDADQFKGRIIVFDNATTTTALRGQATDITANTGASNPLFTFSALTTAPQSGDTFSIV